MTSKWPVNNLPEDILRGILQASHAHQFPHCRLFNGTSPDSPVALTHVCRRWRQAALSLPTLWSCIHVAPELSKGCDDMVEAYLARSSSLPITIVFICHTVAFEENPGWDVGWEDFERTIWPRFKRSWDLLVRQQSRWRHCAIFTLYDEATTYLLHSLDGAIFPQLEHFGVTSYSEVDDDAVDCTLNFFAPALTHFRTDILPTLHSSSEVFHNLTELKLNKLTMEANLLTRILSSVSMTLTTLVLSEVLILRPQIINIVTPVMMRQLAHVALCMVRGVEPAGVHRTQTARPSFVPILCQGSPKLMTLHISGDGEFVVDLCDTSMPSAFKTIQRIEYATTHRERSAWLLLTRFAALRELELLQPTDVHFILDQIARESYSSSSWRYLHTIGIQGDADGSALLKLLQARARIGCPVRRLLLAKRTISRLTPSTREAIQNFNVEMLPFPGRPLQPDHGGLTIPAWDTDQDRPAFIPWKNTYPWNFVDQFPGAARSTLCACDLFRIYNTTTR